MCFYRQYINRDTVGPRLLDLPNSTLGRCGALDKSDPMRSHTIDALGYMIAYDFGIRPKAGERADGILLAAPQGSFHGLSRLAGRRRHPFLAWLAVTGWFGTTIA